MIELKHLEENKSNRVTGFFDMIKYIKDDKGELTGLAEIEIEDKIARFLNIHNQFFMWRNVIYLPNEDLYKINYGIDSSD